jgi:hypothetical protein
VLLDRIAVLCRFDDERLVFGEKTGDGGDDSRGVGTDDGEDQALLGVGHETTSGG